MNPERFNAHLNCSYKSIVHRTRIISKSNNKNHSIKEIENKIFSNSKRRKS